MPIAAAKPQHFRDAGFTVIEALIAMAILAVSALALIGVSETQVTRIDGLERRAIAGWVAENKLAELEVPGMPPTGSDAPVVMLGRNWTVGVEFTDTADPDLKRVAISVSEAGSRNEAGVLDGFIDGRNLQP